MSIQEGGTFTPDNRIVSPGVFLREFDQSGIAQGIADIGGVIVAPFPKGPAFSPTLFRNINDLQNVFGVPDGVFYGPYTATEYLKERGLVTVVRVGGLTGYQQKYPFAIWAQSGSWDRNSSAGNLVSSSVDSEGNPIGSFVYFSGSILDGFSTSVIVGSGSITASNASFTVTFQPSRSEDPTFDTGSTSGSLLYYGQIISLGLADFKASTLSSISSSAQFSASIVDGTFAATIPSGKELHFIGGKEPFENVFIYNGTIKSTLGLCNVPVIELAGVLSGSFGQYNGTFTSESPKFDPCTNSWSGSADLRLLAILNDTQYGGIQDLIAPGFSGSILSGSEIWPNNSIGETFNLILKNTDSLTPYGVYQFSMDESDPHYITNVFGNNPDVGNPATQVTGQKIEAAYLYKVFENSIAEIAANRTEWKIVGSAIPNVDISNGTGSISNGMFGEPENFTDAYSRNLTNGDSTFSITHATTPWIISQQVAPWQSGAKPSRYRLFRIHTLSDGSNMNTAFKAEVSNIKLAGTVNGSNYGSFTLSIRRFSDTDKKPVYAESYPNCNLDPNSSNFVARRVGDRYNYINNLGKIIEFGTFTNNSKNIRIEMVDGRYPVSSIPYGFEAFTTPIDSSAGYWTPTMKYTKASVYGLNPGKYPSGITFDDAPVGADTELSSLYPQVSFGNGSSLDNRQYFAPLPTFGGYTSIGRNTPFALDDDYELYGVGTGTFLSGSNISPAIYDVVNEPTYIKMRKFILGFQGGFDGQSPAIPINIGGDISPGNTQGLNCTTVSSAGSIAYNQCIAALGNAGEFDINLIVVPGILHEHHPYVTNLIVEMCEKRGDVFYILDMYSDDGNPSAGQIDQIVAYAGEYDTNYAATYYPWIRSEEYTSEL